MKHLLYFDALARLGHFGRASEACAVTQPALSMQIKELEALVGAPLVERAARKVQLTALGEEFARRTRDVILAVRELEDLARSAAGSLVGKLQIGVIPTIAPYFLPRLIDIVSKEYPELDLRPREAMTHQLIKELLDGELDLAVLALPTSEPSLQEFALFEEEFHLVRPAGSEGSPVPSPKALKNMRLLLLEEGHCFRDQALSFCKANSSELPNPIEGTSLTTLVQMVSAGMGVTLIPEMALALETRSANVSVDRFLAHRPSRTVGMVWRKTNPLGDELGQLAETIGAVGKTPLDDGEGGHVKIA